MTCLSRPLSNLQFFEKDKIIPRNRRVGCCAVRETDPGKNRAHGGHALSQTQDKGDEACATIWGSAAGPLTENGGGGQARSWKAPTWGQCLLRPSSQGRAESSCARRRRRRKRWGSGRRPARVTRAVPSEERPTVSPIVHTLSPKFATTTTFSNRKNLILIRL